MPSATSSKRLAEIHQLYNARTQRAQTGLIRAQDAVVKLRALDVEITDAARRELDIASDQPEIRQFAARFFARSGEMREILKDQIAEALADEAEERKKVLAAYAEECRIEALQRRAVERERLHRQREAARYEAKASVQDVL